jgi:hypothetical protein
LLVILFAGLVKKSAELECRSIFNYESISWLKEKAQKENNVQALPLFYCVQKNFSSLNGLMAQQKLREKELGMKIFAPHLNGLSTRIIPSKRRSLPASSHSA